MTSLQKLLHLSFLYSCVTLFRSEVEIIKKQEAEKQIGTLCELPRKEHYPHQVKQAKQLKIQLISMFDLSTSDQSFNLVENSIFIQTMMAILMTHSMWHTSSNTSKIILNFSTDSTAINGSGSTT